MLRRRICESTLLDTYDLRYLAPTCRYRDTLVTSLVSPGLKLNRYFVELAKPLKLTLVYDEDNSEVLDCLRQCVKIHIK